MENVDNPDFSTGLYLVLKILSSYYFKEPKENASALHNSESHGSKRCSMVEKNCLQFAGPLGGQSKKQAVGRQES